MRTAIPVLRIFDEAKAREFYLEFLGFKVDWEHRSGDETPVYLQISSGDCVLQLSEHFGDGSPGACVFVQIENIEAYQTELLSKKYKYSRPLVDEKDWGASEMSIADPFGNRLRFAELKE